MSDVIRRASFVLDFVSGNSDITPPDIAAVIKAREDEKKAVDDAADAVKRAREEEQRRLGDLEVAIIDKTKREQESTDAANEGLAKHKEAIDQATEQYEGLGSAGAESLGDISSATQQTIEGVLILTRSFVLLGASEEDVAGLVQKLALLQGTIDLLAGSRKVLLGLKAAMRAMNIEAAAMVALLGGPVGVALTSLVAGLVAASVAWKLLTQDVDDHTKALLREEQAQTASNNAKKQLSTDAKLASSLRKLAGTSDEDNAIITAREDLAIKKRFSDQFRARESRDNQDLEEQATADAAIALQSAIKSKAQTGVDTAQRAFDKAKADDAENDPFELSLTKAEQETGANLQQAKQELKDVTEEILEIGKTIKSSLFSLREAAESQENSNLGETPHFTSLL